MATVARQSGGQLLAGACVRHRASSRCVAVTSKTRTRAARDRRDNC